MRAKFKSIIAGFIATVAMCASAVPVSAWSSSNSFWDLKVYNTGWHVFTLYQKGYFFADMNITEWGSGRGNIKVDVYSGPFSETQTFTSESRKTWALETNKTYNMDAICTAKISFGSNLCGKDDYRTISGEYNFY